jgi:hypothetical protein
MTELADMKKELEAMKTVGEALGNLEKSSVLRVLRWASDHFGALSLPPKLNKRDEVSDAEDDDTSNGIPNFGDVAELFAAACPTTEAHMALVVAYWVQYLEGNDSIDSQIVNKKLKNIGYGVGNITRAFESLKKTKPQLVVQLRKSGQTQQARKTFKVTAAGKKFVEDLLMNGSNK